MRSCLILLGLLGALATQSTVSAQNIIPNNRPPAPSAAVAVPVPGPTGSGVGQSVSANAKLWAGDIISVLIVEDQEKPWTLTVGDQGKVEIGTMGAIEIAGRTSNDAAAIISSYLEKDFYHKATVRVHILKKAPDSVATSKAMLDGKLGRPGPLRFTEADPLTLSEAVTMGMPSEWADLRKVKLTRGGQSTEHDVEAIIKGGRTDLDLKLKDGDRIYVPKAGGFKMTRD